jgi:CRISPR system Cascade subunit CasB
MSLDEKQTRFIGNLLNLAKEGEEDLGALADLRSGLGKEPGEMTRVHRHVVPYLPENVYHDRWYYLIATLFGAFPRHRNGFSLGAAFRPLKRQSDSIEARFVTLLNADPDDFGDHLRHGMSLLRAHEQPIDWFRFFSDLLQWDHPDGRVQLRWARDFYRVTKGEGGPSAETKDSHISK